MTDAATVIPATTSSRSQSASYSGAHSRIGNTASIERPKYSRKAARDHSSGATATAPHTPPIPSPIDTDPLGGSEGPVDVGRAADPSRSERNRSSENWSDGNGNGRNRSGGNSAPLASIGLAPVDGRPRPATS